MDGFYYSSAFESLNAQALLPTVHCGGGGGRLCWDSCGMRMTSGLWTLSGGRVQYGDISTNLDGI